MSSGAQCLTCYSTIEPETANIEEGGVSAEHEVPPPLSLLSQLGAPYDKRAEAVKTRDYQN